MTEQERIELVANEIAKQLAARFVGAAATLSEVAENGGELYEVFLQVDDLLQIARAVLVVAGK